MTTSAAPTNSVFTSSTARTAPPVAPPFDPELKVVLDIVTQSIPATLTIDDLDVLRGPGFTPGLEQLLEGRPINHQQHLVPGPAGAPDVLISVFTRDDHVAPGPGFFFTHVGGLIFGDRFVGVAPVVDYVESMDAVVVTVEYRLAPENPSPAALDDAYAALVWTADHAADLGIDPDRLVAVGASAGGGLAAGLALRARDEHGPHLAGSILMWPMLDERNNTVSSHQIDGIGVWDHTSNETGWNASLGARRHGDTITPYESPSRETDLTDLPPTYIQVGSAEVFRDEAVAYASAIWAAGGNAELHVWPGGYHLFELFAPAAALSVEAAATRATWIHRTLNM